MEQDETVIYGSIILIIIFVLGLIIFSNDGDSNDNCYYDSDIRQTICEQPESKEDLYDPVR